MEMMEDIEEQSELHQSEPSLSEEPSDLHSFRLHVVTWNVATIDPPDDVASLLHLNSPKSADLYVIGLQEVYSGPVRFVSDMIFEDLWSGLFTSTLAPLQYIKVSSMRMQGLLLLFFSKLEHVPFIRDVQERCTGTGLCDCWGNKGGVSICLLFYGHTLCFLNCHLAAHMDYVAKRIDDFKKIVKRQMFDCKQARKITDHRLVFWFGDLNFRISDLSRSHVLSTINEKNYTELWRHDQLIMMMKKEMLRYRKNKCRKKFLKDFEEGQLDFQPSYKFDLNSDDYDSSLKKRKPAWTDRILWQMRPKAPPPDEQDAHCPCLDEEKMTQFKAEEEYPLTVRQELYTSMMEYKMSDHKPVIGIFTLELKKMT